MVVFMKENLNLVEYLSINLIKYNGRTKSMVL